MTRATASKTKTPWIRATTTIQTKGPAQWWQDCGAAIPFGDHSAAAVAAFLRPGQRRGVQHQFYRSRARPQLIDCCGIRTRAAAPLDLHKRAVGRRRAALSRVRREEPVVQDDPCSDAPRSRTSRSLSCCSSTTCWRLASCRRAG